MKNLIFCLTTILIILVFTNCQQGVNNAVPADLTGFTTTPIAGGVGMKAVKTDANGKVLEEGILINGKRNGSWVTYHPNKEKIVKSLANYVDDQLNGIFLTFSDRGQVETLTTYANGVYDGNYAKFRFGNLQESATYVNGELNGLYKKYHESNRFLQVEAEYKNGKQDGLYKFYDESGNVVMEYEYKNGEKVGGGMK